MHLSFQHDPVASTGSLFDGSNPFSATAWIRGDTKCNDSTIIGKMAQGGDYTGWEFHVGTTDLGSGPGKLNVWLINSYGADYIQVNSPMRVLDGTRHHAAFTCDGSCQAAGAKIYVDGQEATGSVAVNSLTCSLQNSVEVDLGTRQNGAFHNFTGALREILLWDVARTPEDVARILQKGVPTEGVHLNCSRFTPPPGS